LTVKVAVADNPSLSVPRTTNVSDPKKSGAGE
jgi:hypothetical protein